MAATDYDDNSGAGAARAAAGAIQSGFNSRAGGMFNGSPAAPQRSMWGESDDGNLPAMNKQIRTNKEQGG